jgi:mono/diheme cytochrome c family protein
MGRTWITIWIVLAFALGCKSTDTETVSRCHPQDGDCSELLKRDQTTASADDPKLGERSYVQRCAPCHGSDGKGGGTMDRGDFTSSSWHTRFSDEEIMTAIRNGRGMKMPGQHVPPVEIKALVGYLRSLQPVPTVKPSGTSTSPY